VFRNNVAHSHYGTHSGDGADITVDANLPSGKSCTSVSYFAAYKNLYAGVVSFTRT